MLIKGMEMLIATCVHDCILVEAYLFDLIPPVRYSIFAICHCHFRK